jgi:putative NIF3 family GTP cyclohydrolase 1 type 2
MDLEMLVKMTAASVGATAPRRVGPADQPVGKVAFACGSGGSFLAAAKRRGCDALITGEATFHTCLEAEALGIGLGLLGHYWSERFAMERLAASLSEALPDLTIWPSRQEYDPIVTVHL